MVDGGKLASSPSSEIEHLAPENPSVFVLERTSHNSLDFDFVIWQFSRLWGAQNCSVQTASLFNSHIHNGVLTILSQEINVDPLWNAVIMILRSVY